jgi:hypothetical protein
MEEFSEKELELIKRVQDATIREVILLILKTADNQPEDDLEVTPKVVLQVFAVQLADQLQLNYTIN